MRFDAVILGSGLGGLQCAYILAKNGMKVCVVEKNAALGGCLQSFRRGNDEFDTGFHYVGALGKGQILERIFRFFGLMDLSWHQLDPEGFDQVIFKDRNYLLRNGYESFAQGLAASFPLQEKQIRSYSSFLKGVGDRISEPLLKESDGFSGVNELFARNAFDFLNGCFPDGHVKDIVSGTSMKMDLRRDSLPLYTFAQINSSYIQSAWRLRGRGSLIADTLANGIKRMGGCIMNSTSAVELKEKDGRIVAVEVEGTTPGLLPDGRKGTLEADIFVSGLSPQLTLRLLRESSVVRPVFRRRINSIPQTFGAFTLNLKLKEGRIPYLNRNVYYYSPDLASVWDIAEETQNGRIKGILITQEVPSGEEKSASQMDILTPMSFNDVARWQDTLPMRRGDGYKEFKARKAEECLTMAETVFPGLKNSIEKIYTSTPLTYMNYTGAIEGSAYGIRKDCNNLLKTLLAAKTPLPNLYFTGQNLNLHGILGVSMTSLMTCSQILGKDRVVSFLEE